MSEEEKRAAAAAVPAARSGTLAGCLLRLLLIIVFILGVLMVFRGVSFDKLMNDPADAVRQMLGKVPIEKAVSGLPLDTKRSAFMYGMYDILVSR